MAARKRLKKVEKMTSIYLNLETVEQGNGWLRLSMQWIESSCRFVIQTSTWFVHYVGESPYVRQSNWITNASKDKLHFTRPMLSSRLEIVVITAIRQVTTFVFKKLFWWPRKRNISDKWSSSFLDLLFFVGTMKFYLSTFEKLVWKYFSYRKMRQFQVVVMC